MMKMSRLCLVVLLTLRFPSSLSSRACPVSCVCYEHANLVDCQDQGFLQVPRGLPHGFGARPGRDVARSVQAFFSLSFLEKLDLSWNLLTTVPEDFSWSMSGLKELRLEHNNLRRIPQNSFQSLDSLEKLDLSYNELEAVGPGVLRGLSRLRQLYLQNNRLSVVQRGSMDMLPGLEVLDLSNNNVSHIDTEALAPLYSLAVLALDGNKLHNLKFKTFISLHTTATHIQLSGNPWSCDCELHRDFSKILFVRYLHIDDYRNVTCHEPPLLAGYSLAWVDSRLCVAETATVLVITVTVLVTVVGALVMAERNRKRKERSSPSSHAPWSKG
uniref:Uncharacterized protein n=1 Tax=Periophthalmus magnuspinnatus TaxID=409849 RepID=A0A3B4ASP1_9GOBI